MAMSEKEAREVLANPELHHHKKVYWAQVVVGEREFPEEIGSRGKDRFPRHTKMRKELAVRMNEAYGFDIHEEIAKARAAAERVHKMAMQAEDEGDLKLALQAARDSFTVQDKFLNTMLPYVEHKKATRSVEDEGEEIQTFDLDAAVTQRLEKKSGDK